MKIKKITQGTYISIETKKVLDREAKRKGVFTTTLASEILEKEARKILRKESYAEVPEQKEA